MNAFNNLCQRLDYERRQNNVRKEWEQKLLDDRKDKQNTVSTENSGTAQLVEVVEPYCDAFW